MKKLSGVLIFLFFCLPLSFVETQNNGVANDKAILHVGVILDLTSTVGNVTRACISIAYSNFYKIHPNQNTRVVIHMRDSKGDPVTATSAALDLIHNIGVKAIIGLDSSVGAEFVAYVGSKSHIPILSFSPTHSSISLTQAPYLIRVAQNDSSQVKAIAAIIQAYKLKELSIIHDDSRIGNALVPSLAVALSDVDAQVFNKTIIPSTANATIINNSLLELKSMKSKVFVVHMSPSLAASFFLNVHKQGMMSKGYVWIITTAIADVMSYMEPSVLRSMNGVIGVKAHVPETKSLKKFSIQFQKRFKQNDRKLYRPQPNINALRAYDVMFLMAMVANKVQPRFNDKNSLSPPANKKGNLGLFDNSVSTMGSKFLQAIQAAKFTGLSGEIQFIDGQLQSNTYRIINVLSKRDRTIGYWTPGAGLSKNLNIKTMQKDYSANDYDLGSVIWPGGSKVTPKAITLTVGVPYKTGFVEFMSANRDKNTNSWKVTGFSKDVFETVMFGLPYEYDYVPYEINGVSAGNYNKLTYSVYTKQFDVVVGDVTIVANRSRYVEFSQPYSNSGVRMITLKTDKNLTSSLWWFLWPWSKDLWFITIAFFLTTGFSVWVFERGKNPEFQGPLSQQLGKYLSFSFSISVFAHKEKLESNYSRFIVSLWSFSVYILMGCFIANLTSMLTAKNLQTSTVTGSVGYQSGSFVSELLVDLGYHPSKLVQLSTIGEYANALKNGSVSAIYDEIPFIKVFLAHYCNEFTVAGPTYPAGGFGFVFPLDSPLVSYASHGVLEFAEGNKMKEFEEKWFGRESCYDNFQKNTTWSQQLHLYSFRSVFIIMGVASVSTLGLFFASDLVYKSAKENGGIFDMVRKKFVNDVADAENPPVRTRVLIDQMHEQESYLT
ncbi:glutamate receptor 2.7-like isoform X1 [Papaver somniferum]|uniref:glutamate receptor 2.7-like isoform X1 n=1 Tax=Papaver somniferum TaxID=3469 RepID=UPI000E704650|nr:glutamate receptor 2.7-like isoform X1 [Papaver somniferum]